MTSYNYIQDFFRAVLLQSKQIQGRFYILPKNGQELNAEELGQLFVNADGERKFPLAIMTPPRSSGVFMNSDEWEKYRFVMFFLNTTYYTGGNEISDVDPYTNTSQHTVISDWEEMKVAAVDFIRVLRVVQKGGNDQSLNMLNSIFRLPNDQVFIDPVSFTTTKRLSGVRLSFEASLYIGCNIEDYVSGGVVVLPPQDESTFEPELAIVRNEVVNILAALGLDGGFIS